MNKLDSCCQWIHPRFYYLEAKTIHEALILLSKYRDKAKLIAGGTDLLIKMKRGRIRPEFLVDIVAIPNLSFIDYDSGGLKIGALTSLDDIENSPLIKEVLPVIAYSAHQIGNKQIRNVATIGGNLCNAAPSADMAPSLIASGAKVKINGLKGGKTITFEEFFVGPGETALKAEEMLTEIHVPNSLCNTRSVYLRLPASTAIGIAIVGVAAVATLDSQGADIVDVKIVLGAVAPTPIRVRKAEDIIKRNPINNELIKKAAQAAADESRPISDIRASAAYRKEMVRVLTDRALKHLATCH